jgi:hypothetical protein
MAVVRKTEIGPIAGTPDKRMFWSSITDYDLKTGLSELIGNAIDLWMMEDRKRLLAIAATLDPDRQLIVIHDNAGGIQHGELRLLIAPGGSRNNPHSEVIGILGVGGRRTDIALGEHVEIKTRHKKLQTYQADITKDWLEIEGWEIPAYEIPHIEPSTKNVEISQLSQPFSQVQVDEFITHLGETYSWFLHSGCTLTVNDQSICAKVFDHWAYPRGFSPRNAKFKIKLGTEEVSVTIAAGVIADRDPEQKNKRVYVYCNHRLLVRELKTRYVGYFVTAEACVPHPDASLCRAIVHVQEPAKLMPWNGSKSGVNPGHQIFQRIRPTLIQLVAYFSSLSRRLKNAWGEKFTSNTSGTIEQVKAAEAAPGRRPNLPDLPRVNKSQVEQLKARNKKTLKDQPWTVGLAEVIAAVDVITRQRFDTKNRIAAVLLNGDFGIGLKEFIVHRADLLPRHNYNDTKIAQLFKSRSDVIKEVTPHVKFPAKLPDKVRHYYGFRNKLIYERATVGITDNEGANYRATTEEVLSILFKLNFRRVGNSPSGAIFRGSQPLTRHHAH